MSQRKDKDSEFLVTSRSRQDRDAPRDASMRDASMRDASMRDASMRIAARRSRDSPDRDWRFNRREIHSRSPRRESGPASRHQHDASGSRRNHRGWEGETRRYEDGRRRNPSPPVYGRDRLGEDRQRRSYQNGSDQSRPYGDSRRNRRDNDRYLDYSRHRRDSSPIRYRHEVRGREEQRRANRPPSKSSSGSDSSDNENVELTEDQLIAKLMGVTEFNTTKNKNHASTALSGINKKTKRRYRQYMNRRGGFNRPLSPVL